MKSKKIKTKEKQNWFSQIFKWQNFKLNLARNGEIPTWWWKTPLFLFCLLYAFWRVKQRRVWKRCCAQVTINDACIQDQFQLAIVEHLGIWKLRNRRQVTWLCQHLNLSSLAQFSSFGRQNGKTYWIRAKRQKSLSGKPIDH